MTDNRYGSGEVGTRDCFVYETMKEDGCWMNIDEIADYVPTGYQATYNRIMRLVNSGLAEKRPDPDDARRKLYRVVDNNE